MAYLLCVGMAWGYTYVKPWVGRVLVGALCIGLLSWMGGAAFAPLAVMLFLYEIGQKGRGEWRISFVYLFIALAIGYGFYRMGGNCLIRRSCAKRARKRGCNSLPILIGVL